MPGDKLEKLKEGLVILLFCCIINRLFLESGSSVVKNLLANAGNTGLILPWFGKIPWWGTVHRVEKSWTQLSTYEQ